MTELFCTLSPSVRQILVTVLLAFALHFCYLCKCGECGGVGNVRDVGEREGDVGNIGELFCTLSPSDRQILVTVQ